jgi:carbohydrate diacid regulator
MDRGGVQAVFYVGTPQISFSQYIYAYRHCKWMESRYRGGKDLTGTDRVRFFYDCASEYFYSVLPREELHRVFFQYNRQLQKEDRRQFIETVGALIETNFNLTEAAKKLYIHKNTMMYRYNKLKDMLDMDPIRAAADRTFLILLYHSLQT